MLLPHVRASCKEPLADHSDRRGEKWKQPDEFVSIAALWIRSYRLNLPIYVIGYAYFCGLDDVGNRHSAFRTVNLYHGEHVYIVK